MVEAEAGNEVASIGRIGKRNLFTFGYTNKAYDCVAIRLRYNNHLADNSATPPPTD